jgi:hypothetical protein
MAAVPHADAAPFLCPAGSLKVGDRVRTPARRWETVTAVDQGDAYSRSTRVVTDGTGPDFPWVWRNRHPLIAHRPAPAEPCAAAILAGCRADRPAA